MGLALVMIEKHARRTVHLRNDHPLGPVDDKRSLLGHEGNVAHVDILLLDVLDRARLRFLVDFPDDETQFDLQRSRVGHVALNALLDIVFRLLEFVGHVFEHGALVEILDRENRAKHRFNTIHTPLRRTHFTLKELLVR